MVLYYQQLNPKFIISKHETMDELKKLFEQIFSKEKLVKAVFSAKRTKSLPYSRVTLRPVMISGELCYQAEYTYEKKAIHKNINCESAVRLCTEIIASDFKQANIFTDKSDIQILASKPQKPRITQKPSSLSCMPVSHNRTKKHIIPDGTPCDFLIQLGVMDSEGKVIQKHYSKFRQINRYLEIVEDCMPYLKEREKNDTPLKIIDFGCGKAYLTFAIYHYLKNIKNMEVNIIGLDLKEDVISFCNKTAAALNFDNLKFMIGDIADYTNDYADMVVTLHACDTATDYALINAVKWNTKIILSVPCCQHELFSQIKNDIHQPILKDRLTEYLTDGLRGLKLESCGYDVAMIEFTGLEHTARNIMIKAVKRPGANPYDARSKKARSEYEKLRDFYNVHPSIDAL